MERKEGEEALGDKEEGKGHPAEGEGFRKERTERKGPGRGTQRKCRGVGMRRNKGKRARRGRKKRIYRTCQGGSSNRREKVFQRQNLGQITRCKRQEWKESQMTES